MQTNNENNIFMKNFHLKGFVLSLIALIISLILLIVLSLEVIQQIEYTWIPRLIETIASTLMVAGTIGLLFQSIALNEIMAIIERHFTIFKGINEVGLNEIHANDGDFSFEQMLLYSHHLIIVINDGRRWVGRHSDLLRKRMMTPNYKTTFIFQHPQSDMIKILANKTDHPIVYIQEKIEGTVKELHSFQRDKTHELKTYGHHFYNVYALFLSDDLAAFTPYYIAPGRYNVPIFAFHKKGCDSHYQMLHQDAHNLVKLSQELLP